MKEMKGVEAVGHQAHGSTLNGHRPQRASRYPDKETLQRMVNEMPVTAIAEKLGVSDTAVARECKNHGIVKPGRGDLAKTKATKRRAESPAGAEESSNR